MAEHPVSAADAVFEIYPSILPGDDPAPDWPHRMAKSLFSEPIDMAITAGLAEIGALTGAAPFGTGDRLPTFRRRSHC